jgi:hypothetical protein
VKVNFGGELGQWTVICYYRERLVTQIAPPMFEGLDYCHQFSAQLLYNFAELSPIAC